LLGEKVRFDGGHKRDAYLTDILGQFATFVPVCPEVEIGLGTPRETLRLVRLDNAIHLVAQKSGADHTEAMHAYALRRAEDFARLNLSGYILKKDSPSCGMERVRVYDENDVPAKIGQGIFAAVLLEQMPHLPVEEEGRLQDPRLRENFVERVFAYRRLLDFFTGSWKMGDLVRFHAAEKFLVLAHDATAYERLGRLVARGKGIKRKEIAVQYGEIYMAALKKIATVRRHANVLQHLAGFLKDLIGPEDKQELSGVIGDYREGLVPLVVPLTLIRHYVRRHQVAYLEGQYYLEPHPKELMLRNHV
jgi:uncharacterized protein YbgA (DUF1722 family)/uncharacterized protein YbbK (DUF523 family)